MRGKLRALLYAVVALALAAQPVAAAPTTTAKLINGLNNKLLIIAIPVTLLTEAALIYAVWKFRGNDDPKPTEENRRLEITWTIATAIILLFVGAASYGVLAQPSVTYTSDQPIAPEDDDVLVHADAFQWGWEFTYPEEGNFSTSTKIVIPKGQDIYFRITSQDVIHSFGVPAMGLKQDAIPGQSNVIYTVATEKGTYQGYCMEFCGVAHSKMTFTVEVVSPSAYQDWVEKQQSGQ